MNLAELISNAKEDVFDKGTTPYVSEAEWIRFANDAQDQACRRALLIKDSSSEDVCKVGFKSGDEFVSLDPCVIVVAKVVLDSNGELLAKTRADLMDLNVRGWEANTGDVTAYLQDVESGKLRLYPIPEADGDLSLTVYRTALEAMAEDDDEPEIPARYHEGLIHWMRYRAYSKQDNDLENMARAKINLALFEQEFGPARTARDEQFINERELVLPLEGQF